MKNGKSCKTLFASMVGALIILLLLVTFPTRALARSNPHYRVQVDSGYLALRNYPSYDDRNEIGELYTGDIVEVIDSSSNGTYWWVRSNKYADAGWVNKNYLVYYDGGGYGDGGRGSSRGTYRVAVAKGYLALRTAPSYNSANEIGELYTGDTVEFISRHNGTYWWVYSPKYDREGYVNRNYLYKSTYYTEPSYSTYGDYNVSVAKGYLALRTAPAYKEENEIGELYTGDTVTVLGKSAGKYWWVYSPKYDREGYVNCNYIYRRRAYTDPSYGSYGRYSVSVAKGYLALRTAPAYKEENEIGELYTGDTVTVLGKSGGTYWWVYSPKYDREGYVNKKYLVR